MLILEIRSDADFERFSLPGPGCSIRMASKGKEEWFSQMGREMVGKNESLADKSQALFSDYHRIDDCTVVQQEDIFVRI